MVGGSIRCVNCLRLSDGWHRVDCGEVSLNWCKGSYLARAWLMVTLIDKIQVSFNVIWGHGNLQLYV